MCFHCDSHCPLCFHIVPTAGHNPHNGGTAGSNGSTHCDRNFAIPTQYFTGICHLQIDMFSQYSKVQCVNLKKKEGGGPNVEASGRERGVSASQLLTPPPCNRSAPAVKESLIEFLTPALLNQPILFKYHNPFNDIQF